MAQIQANPPHSSCPNPDRPLKSYNQPNSRLKPTTRPERNGVTGRLRHQRRLLQLRGNVFPEWDAAINAKLQEPHIGIAMEQEPCTTDKLAVNHHRNLTIPMYKTFESHLLPFVFNPKSAVKTHTALTEYFPKWKTLSDKCWSRPLLSPSETPRSTSRTTRLYKAGSSKPTAANRIRQAPSAHTCHAY